MNRNLSIALRFLFAKRRAMLMSLAGIVFGVSFFIVAQAQTSGFERFFIRTILGINGAVRVQDHYQETISSIIAHGEGSEAGFEIPLREGRAYVPGVANPNAVVEAVKAFESVIAVAPVLRGNTAIRGGIRTEEGRVLGINIAEYLQVSDLASYIRMGSLVDFERDPVGIILGNELASRLQIRIGDTVLLRHLGGQRRYRVSAIFESGVDQYDRYHFYVHMNEARILLNRPHEITYLQVAVEDPARAPEIAEHMSDALHHSVVSWQDRERSWLEVFQLLRISSGITMSVIILVAGLGMFNTLAIIVMERQREIAILRSMGYTRGDITMIFIDQGLIVLGLGIVIGWIFALGLTFVVENIPIQIRGIFTTDRLIVEWSISHYLWGAVVAIFVVLLASYFPARRAARIEPGQIIRGTGG